MRKKIIALCIIGMFLLTGLAAVTATDVKTAEEISEPGADLAVEFCPYLNDDGIQIGFDVVFKNVGTETVKGYISANYKSYRGFNKFFPIFLWWGKLTVLENEQELKPGEEIKVHGCRGYDSFYIGLHINHFVVKLNFDDENPDNNVCELTTLTILIPRIIERMYFI